MVDTSLRSLIAHHNAKAAILSTSHDQGAAGFCLNRIVWQKHPLMGSQLSQMLLVPSTHTGDPHALDRSVSSLLGERVPVNSS